MVLVGHTWDPIADTWPQDILVPHKDLNKNDSDDFHAMQRFINNLIKDENLAKIAQINPKKYCFLSALLDHSGRKSRSCLTQRIKRI